MENVKKNFFLNNFIFQTIPITSHLFKATIQVSNDFVNPIYKQTIELYKKKTYLPGLKSKDIPSEYLEDNYKKEIENNLKNFLFKHTVLNFLLAQIRNKKIILTNYPRLSDIKISSDKNVCFDFDLSIADPIELKEWKNFIFRAPKRKRYKDADKQVDLFLKRESSLFKKQDYNTVEENDWVCFITVLLDENQKPVLPDFKSSFWIKVNNKYLTKPFFMQLIGRKIGDSFITNDLPTQNDFSSDIEYEKYSFLIEIKMIAKGSFFSLESFKTIFQLKSKADIHKKLIEVFSYRNDISQRKSIIEELFHLLLSKHRFEIPKHFVIRREEDIILSLKKHPDYQVYKQQKDFLNQIETLAEKVIKEEIMIDQIAYQENIKIDHRDIQNYLYLFNNNRLKEFVYFKPFEEKIEESEQPLHKSCLEQSVLREKTLNYIIHELTK
ncbi:MAG: trigger factor [Candidatus Babeliales bacterium]